MHLNMMSVGVLEPNPHGCQGMPVVPREQDKTQFLMGDRLSPLKAKPCALRDVCVRLPGKQINTCLLFCAGCLAGFVPNDTCVYPSPLNIWTKFPIKSDSSNCQLMKIHQLKQIQMVHRASQRFGRRLREDPLPPSGVRACSVSLPMCSTASQQAAMLQRNTGFGILLWSSPSMVTDKSPHCLAVAGAAREISLALSGATVNFLAVTWWGQWLAAILAEVSEDGKWSLLPWAPGGLLSRPRGLPTGRGLWSRHYFHGSWWDIRRALPKLLWVFVLLSEN